MDRRHFLNALAGTYLLAGSGPGAARAGEKKEKPEPQSLRLGSATGLVPGDWKAEAPIGQFRLAQYTVPRAEGDTAATQFLVFHFGKGGGGSVDDNLERWIRMMRQPEGTDLRKVVKLRELKREGLRIIALDLPGTYLDRPFPASQQITPRPNYRLLAAIVETTGEGGDGPYYLRLVGPEKTVAAALGGWDALLESLKAE